MHPAIGAGTFAILWTDTRTGIVLAASGEYQLGVMRWELVFSTFEEAKAERIVEERRYTEAVVLDDAGRELWKAAREWTVADLPRMTTRYTAPIEWVLRQWRRVSG